MGLSQKRVGRFERCDLAEYRESEARMVDCETNVPAILGQPGPFPTRVKELKSGSTDRPAVLLVQLFGHSTRDYYGADRLYKQ